MDGPPGQHAALAQAVVCYATADWDAPLWTNKQHLMSRLAESGIPVLYVDSPGHRAPTASASDARRIAHRLALWRPSATEIRPGLWRDSPLLIPNYSHASIVSLNEHLLKMRLRRNERGLRLERPLLWTYTPLASPLYDRRRHSGLIYHCVDDIAAFPGVDGHHFLRSEQALARSATICIGSSLHLVRHLEELGAKDVRYWPNPADTYAFSSAKEKVGRRRRGTRPVVGFLGAVQEHKVDVELIRNCARSLPEVDFVIAGPLGHGLGRSTLDPSTFPRNVSFPGSIPLKDAPALVATFDVGIIPYRINEYTAGVFPMKVFEYLASGLPVVSTALPSLVGQVEHIILASDQSQFLSGLNASLAAPSSPKAATVRADYASKFSWERRVDDAIELISETYQDHSNA